MRIGILVNTLESRSPGRTTYGLAAEATNRGHEVWITSAGNLIYDVDDQVRALARTVPVEKYSAAEKVNDALRERDTICETIVVDDLDVLLSAQKREKVNFKADVIDAIERKVWYIRHYRRRFSNVELCAL